MRVLLEGSERVIELTGPPLGRGGEADLYAWPGEPSLAAKVYRQPRPEQADKLRVMLARPPLDPMVASGHVSITWPLRRLRNADGDHGVVGYQLAWVEKGRPIHQFFNPRARLAACPLFHYGYLLRTARNLAAAVRALHEHGHVIGDVNESNVLVTNQALVSLVDTDSFQVRDGGRVFRCRVGKPEYTPPELQTASFADVDRLPEHDAFGLAVLIFQLLMQGQHPFAGVFTGRGEPQPIPRRIAEGQWPYCRGRPVSYRPNPHTPPWAVLPTPVQELLSHCFEDGHADPTRRPGAAPWHRALFDAEKDLTTCPANPQHVYHGGLDSCPWCALARAQQRDPFPAAEALEPAPDEAATRARRAPVTLAAADRLAEAKAPRPPRRRKPARPPPDDSVTTEATAAPRSSWRRVVLASIVGGGLAMTLAAGLVLAAVYLLPAPGSGRTTDRPAPTERAAPPVTVPRPAEPGQQLVPRADRDQDRLQGRWTVATIRPDGPRRRTPLSAPQWVFQGDQLLASAPDRPPWRAVYRLNEEHWPRSIDLLAPAGSGAMRPLLHGVYALDGPSLRLRLTRADRPRPRHLDDESSPDSLFIALHRAP